MTARSGPGGTRWKHRVTLVGTVIATFALATGVYAAISGFNPSIGTVAPGGSATATFTVTPPLGLSSCITATVSPTPARFSVRFDGVGLGPTNCTLVRETEVEMTVSASAQATPGDYTVTITEVALGGSLLDSYEWPLTVVAPATTTTTTPSSTTTTVPTTTSSQPDPATTSTAPTTTSTTSPATTSNTTPSNASTTPSNASTDTVTANAEENTSTDTVTLNEEENTASSSDAAPEDDLELLAVSGPRDGGSRYERPGVEPQSGASWVERSAHGRLIGPGLALLSEIAPSPPGFGELLARSLISSVMPLFAPLVIATLIGMVMAWRLGRKVDDDELALQRQQMV